MQENNHDKLIDFTSWPLHIPTNIQSLFYLVCAPDYDVVQHQIVALPKEKKDVFIEIKTSPDSGPVSMHILGLQQIGVGVQAYYKVMAEAVVDVTSEGMCCS